jgi:hypothetical protein
VTGDAARGVSDLVPVMTMTSSSIVVLSSAIAAREPSITAAANKAPVSPPEHRLWRERMRPGE